MRENHHLIRIKRKTFLCFVAILVALAGVTPVLAEYLGPNRTVTEIATTCKVNLLECQYVPSKKIYRYKVVDNWSCSNESFPWRAYPSSGPDCHAGTAGDSYWERAETTQEVITTYPSATVNNSLQNCTLSNGWCTTPPQLSLSGTEPVSGYRIIAIEGTLNGELFACADSNCSVPLAEGDNTLTYWALSSWGDSSLKGSLTTKVDSQAPLITGALNGTIGSNGWYTSPVSFNGSASDATSGLASFNCILDGTVLGSCNSLSVSADGAHTLALIASDNAGNTRTINQDVSIDTQNPNLNATLKGTLGSNNWYNDAELHASSSDPGPGSGLSAFEYNADKTNWIPFPISGILDLPEGKHSLEVRAVDNAGHTVLSSKSFWLDSIAPDVIVDPKGTLGKNNWYTTDLSLSASATDGTSGLELFEYTRNSSAWTTYTTPLVLTDGVHNITFWAQDFSGLVTQLGRIYQIDTQLPQIAGSISGVPGSNGWYVSNATLSASTADPLPGSGIDAFTYILNGAAETPYTTAITLPDGRHTIQLAVQDKAGLSYSTEQTINVDTIRPALSIQSTFPNWIKDSITLNGTAADGGSGISKVEISTNGGQTWQAVSGTTSWAYGWNTTTDTNGDHNVFVRVTDQAGLVTEQALHVSVDNHAPKVSLPASWYQWETVTLDVWDNHSGLSETRVEISDPEGRWPKRVIRLDTDQYPLDFKWDRRFGDGTIAPTGTYSMKVIAFDNLGNATHHTASIKILLGILPAGSTATPQPYSRNEDAVTPLYAATAIPMPTAMQESVVSTFGNIQPATETAPTPMASSAPRTAPTQTGVLEWIETVFSFSSDSNGQTTELESFVAQSAAPQPMGSGSNILWGAAAASMVSSVMAYALEERRKQAEEQARQRALREQEEERHEKRQAIKLQKLEAKWAQEKAWEEARTSQQYASIGTSAKISRTELKDSEVLAVLAAEKRAQAEEKRKAEELKLGLTAYYAAMRQGEKEAAPPENWWDKTKAFTRDNIIEPFDKYVAKPLIEPAVESFNEKIKEPWVSNVYQPYMAPKVERAKESIKIEFSQLSEGYQTYIAPITAKVGEAIGTGVSWVFTNVVQPWWEGSVNNATQVLSFVNKKIYQPYLQPVVEPLVENTLQPLVASINENVVQPQLLPILNIVKDGAINLATILDKKIYEPIFEPVVKDISQYIYKPAAKKVEDWWSEYGEWVHGALDTVGFVPGVGDMADGLNGLVYLAEGHYIEAGISLVSMIPVLGDLAKSGKLGLKLGTEVIGEAAQKLVKDVAEGTTENVVVKAAGNLAEETTEELTEQVTQKTAENFAEEATAGLATNVTKDAGGEVLEKTAKDSLKTASEKTLKETGEGLSAKVIAESVENTAQKTAKQELVEDTFKKTTDDVTTKTGKAAAENVSEEFVEKTIQEGGEELATKGASETTEGIAQKTAEKELVKDAFEAVSDDTAQKVLKNTTEEKSLTSAEIVSESVKKNIFQDAIQKAYNTSTDFISSVIDIPKSINKTITLLQKHGSNAIKAFSTVSPLAAHKMLRTLDDEVLDQVIKDGPESIAALSSWTTKELKEHGKDLAARSTKDAEVLKDVKTLIKMGPIDPKNLTAAQKDLIERIAANSTFNIDGKQIVLGKWVDLNGGFVQRAKEVGAAHYNPHPDMWKLFGELQNQHEAAWLINKQVIQTGVGKGLPMEYTLNGIPNKMLNNEKIAIEAIFSTELTNKEIMQLLKLDYMPVRIRELQELNEAGYKLTFDSVNNAYMFKP